MEDTIICMQLVLRSNAEVSSHIPVSPPVKEIQLTRAWQVR